MGRHKRQYGEYIKDQEQKDNRLDQLTCGAVCHRNSNYWGRVSDPNSRRGNQVKVPGTGLVSRVSPAS